MSFPEPIEVLIIEFNFSLKVCHVSESSQIQIKSATIRVSRK